MTHQVTEVLLRGKCAVLLVGCGGNGSQMLGGLARLNTALKALGHEGLDVTTFDPDTVSEANVGRQMFSPADIGLNKAVVLTHRINAFYGSDWDAMPDRYGKYTTTGFDLLISCVDSRRARAEIASNISRGGAQGKGAYVMDLGNRAADGQVILGEAWPSHVTTKRLRLPNAYDLLPELIDTTLPDDDAPSCGLAEALERQELFINQSVVTAGLALLWDAFRRGRLEHHGYFINLTKGRFTSLKATPTEWKRFNYPATPPDPAPRRKRKTTANH